MYLPVEGRTTRCVAIGRGNIKNGSVYTEGEGLVLERLGDFPSHPPRRYALADCFALPLPCRKASLVETPAVAQNVP